MQQKETILKQYFGYDSFRSGQAEIIDAMAEGRDLLAIMPTGAGKSICYQVPALMDEGITLVVSPLVSLMKDQVGALLQAGVRAAYINSSLTPGQQQEALRRAMMGAYKIIYVAPERLLTPAFLWFAETADIRRVTVDEAHCVSQWGQDFRPSYLSVAEFIGKLSRRPVLSAFTATATAGVRQDILALLGLEEPLVYMAGYDRPNLEFCVEQPRNKNLALLGHLRDFGGKSGIVYCSTRKAVEAVCEFLSQQGIAATRYHAGLGDAERRANQDDFLYDRAEVMVATNAFGMGIDKSNVSFVIHYNMPKDLESYYQEAGRAGRDGEPAKCILLYSPQDVITGRYFIEHGRDEEEMDPETRARVQEQASERLKRMTFYATTTDCLRGFILRYFGETAPSECGNCSNCKDGFETVDIGPAAKQVVLCVEQLHRLGRAYGKTALSAILRAAPGAKATAASTEAFGTLAGLSDAALRAILDALVREGYLAVGEGEYPVLETTEKSEEVFSGESLTVKLKVATRRAVRGEKAPTEQSANPELLAQLKALRLSLARSAGVPAYAVFTDATLREIATHLPRTNAEFAGIKGVGTVKCNRYGEEFTAAVREYLEKSN